MSDKECEHDYKYQGLYYSHNDYPMAGSGAHSRYYEDVYYCSKCLDTQTRNRVYQGSSYDEPIAGSFPRNKS